MRFRVFGPYFRVHRLGHYKSTFLVWRSKIGVQKQGVKSVKWWFLYLNLHKATLKGLGGGFGPFSRHFEQNSTNSKSAILLGLISTTLHWTLKRGPKVVKIGVLRGFLTGFERVLGVKGRYIVTFGEEAVWGPQKWSKMSIFLLKMVQNHQKSRNLLKCASKQRVQIHGFLKTTKRT